MTSSFRNVSAAAVLLLAGSAIVGCHSDSSNDMSSSKEMSSTKDMSASGNTAGIYSADSRILSTLHEKSQAEIKIGRLAQERGTTEGVRSFGRQLVTDHTALDNRVMSVARENGAPLISSSELARSSANEPRPPAEDPAATLQGLSGPAFDQAFAEKMYQGHKELISTVEAARSNVQQTKVRQLLDDALPELRKHRDMAKSLQHG